MNKPELSSIDDCIEYLTDQHNLLGPQGFFDALPEVFNASQALLNTPTRNLEVLKDGTWNPCTAMGFHPNVEMIPCTFGPGQGYAFVHPQDLRYADSKAAVYQNTKRLLDFFYPPYSQLTATTN